MDDAFRRFDSGNSDDMTGYTGFQSAGTASGSYNTQSFVIQQHMRRINTSTFVMVMGVSNDGGLAPTGTVDILPLVQLVDGDGVLTPHGTIFQIPYVRIQGGANAIIIDPQVGDIGEAFFADRDISSVIANKGQAAPGSARRFDMSDAVYLGAVLGVVPTQVIQFNSEGIIVTSPTEIKLVAPSVIINATTLTINASTSVTVTTPTFTVNGAVVVSETVTAAEVDAPIVTVATTLTVSGKNLGPNHVHSHGTMTATGQTGTVV